MTQPLNYCTQASESMSVLDDSMQVNQKTAKAIIMSAMECIELMHMAEKFIMPDWGKIFDEHEWELCADTQIPTRLPYPIIALEYFCPYSDPRCTPMMNGECRASKRIALCVESEALEEHTDLLKHMHERHTGNVKGFYVYPISYSDDLKFWTPPPCAMFFPRGGNTQFFKMKHDGVISILPLGLDSYQFFPKNEQHVRAMRDVADEAMSVIHLLTALCLDKGRHEVLPAPVKLNKKRAKKGRVPMYEYKILDIVADVLHTPQPADKPHQGGTHASPRMHKRRGHVRRLHSGRTTWVRNAIIGKPGSGTVEKEYAVHE
jgi:hypothetical protein